MARCTRCNACQSMWDMSPCRHCNYPGEDTRTAAQILEDAQDQEAPTGADKAAG